MVDEECEDDGYGKERGIENPSVEDASVGECWFKSYRYGINGDDRECDEECHCMGQQTDGDHIGNHFDAPPESGIHIFADRLTPYRDHAGADRLVSSPATK